MPFYSSGSFHTSFTCASGTRQEIVTGIETALSANGWTVVSGGGTGNVVLQSATPSGGSAIRLRAYDPGSGNCAQCFIQNQSGGNESQAFYLLPAAGKTYYIWGCQYQAFVFTGSAATTAREYFACGALYVPNWLRTSVTEGLWANGSGVADASTSYAGCFRASLATAQSRTQAGPQYVIWTGIVNNVKLDRLVNGANPTEAELQLHAAAPAWYAEDSGRVNAGPRRFQDNTAFETDAWVAFGVASSTDEPKYRGALWDAVVVTDTFSAGTAKTIDSHTFYAFTDSVATNAGGGFVMCATLFLL